MLIYFINELHTLSLKSIIFVGIHTLNRNVFSFLPYIPSYDNVPVECYIIVLYRLIIIASAIDYKGIINCLLACNARNMLHVIC